MKQLHASGEDYLEAVLVIQKKKGMVRSIDVARHMEVSKPSGRNRGDSEDLRVDILHDFCSLCPNIGCGKGRLAEHQ